MFSAGQTAQEIALLDWAGLTERPKRFAFCQFCPSRPSRLFVAACRLLGPDRLFFSQKIGLSRLPSDASVNLSSQRLFPRYNPPLSPDSRRSLCGAPHLYMPARLKATWSKARGSLARLHARATEPRPRRSTSLRRELLRRLAVPLTALALGSALFAYWLCLQYAERQTDRTIATLAISLSEQARSAGNDSPFVLPALARAMLENGDSHDLAYRLQFPDGRTNGLNDLQMPLHAYSDAQQLDSAWLFDSEVDGTPYRVAQALASTPSGPIWVDVGIRRERASGLAIRFLAAVMLPAFLLLAFALAISWRVVNQQIKPLSLLADALNKQTHRSLEAVDESLAPEEIQPLVRALNGLITRLGRASDAQRRFIADAAHQLRTPLTAIKLHADRAATTQDPKAAQAAILEVRDAAARAARLSNQLLSLARAEPGGAPAKKNAFDASALFFELGAEWAPRALAQSVDFGFEIDIPGFENPDAAPPALPCVGDETLARESLSNLIDNALKHSHFTANPSVSLRLSHRREPSLPEWAASLRAVRTMDGQDSLPPTPVPLAPFGWAVGVIEDNGQGVPAEAQSQLFQRFFRADTSDEGGSGLGLAIAQEIARLHQGSLGYQPNPAGGARFYFFLPLQAAPDLTPPPPPNLDLGDEAIGDY